MDLPLFVKELKLEGTIARIIEGLLTEIQEDKLTLDNYGIIIAQVMEEVEKLECLNGSQKKELVIYITNVIHDYIKDNKDISSKLENVLNVVFSAESVSTIVETIISITKKDFKINTKQIACMSKFGLALSLLCCQGKSKEIKK
jgi:hypothetical protein